MFNNSRNDGLVRSTPRFFMLVMTTATFALGIIALVLETSLAYQQFTLEVIPSSSSLWSARRTNVIMAVGATIACTIVSTSSFPLPLPLPVAAEISLPSWLT